MREQPRGSDGKFLPYGKEQRDKRLSLRLNQAELDGLKEAAKRQDCTMTELVGNLIQRGTGCR